ncbi:G2/mitotic-specific cyclin cdc13 OS=Schizosaccharomyces pombe (strain 972 / ATCC 24843) GN=cdc13 PE=1 SV=1 [Rhizoctonia solani AG-1 IB]|uniref:G2/mitotic-specific cyclin cdc13 n=1 Tax=Thanatephorus cucumeris (strain AG1-IB / isolate 7/3/14) TaxID=1108050 RepID=A0A0B7FDC2_THACB|nr:G2/mitotic-specific cyclin cdc13 OS=Schizosaccharomyces pombe (strain 972 / ATCC 24843) GN=cdc13 PE=1 SV=1 [Rhizoctonia solani AG-1 IB]
MAQNLRSRHATRLAASAQNGPRSKLAGPDENANRFAGNNGGKAVLGAQNTGAQRRVALNDLSNNAKKVNSGKAAAVGKIAVSVQPAPQRVPLQQKGSRQVGVPASNSAPVLAQRTTRSASHNENERPVIAPLPKRGPLRKAQAESVAPALVDHEMDIEQPITVETEIEVAPVESVPSPVAEEAYDEEDSMEADEYDPEDWLHLSPDRLARSEAQVNAIRETFKDEVDEWDTTMVSEYADEIFAYMESMEAQCMPNPDYISGQTEIEWSMRTTLVDWLMQVHMRYHMLPETLWIAINVVDRFLSKRVVSLVKLQLVGVTAMFIAAKYEEILAPSVDEFVFMTERGYERDEILKGERIILSTLDFNVSSYCSPYSWCRRISKADDYDIQTRTLSKFLMEMTLLDHRFLRARPSLIAAIGMYSARKMLGGDWSEPFVFYSGFAEDQLRAGHELILERLADPAFESLYVCRKYANKKFLKASVYARDWAKANYQPESEPEMASA